MNEQIELKSVTLQDVLEVTEELSPADQLRLIATLSDRLSREVKETLPLPPIEVPDQEALEQAIALYQQEEISLGRTAEMAGITRWELMRLLKARGTPVTVQVLSAEEMDERIAAFRARTR
jgi:predicted HTH domain antitoxin